MTAAKRQPLVAFLYSVPLLHEALLSTLDSIADVQAFPAGRGDVTGLLRSVKPDAIVVDDADEADEARGWAKRHHDAARAHLVCVTRRSGCCATVAGKRQPEPAPKRSGTSSPGPSTGGGTGHERDRTCSPFCRAWSSTTR